VEDEKRLLEKELRDNNKKKRYEVRYTADNLTSQEGQAEVKRLEEMALRRQSYKHSEK